MKINVMIVVLGAIIADGSAILGHAQVNGTIFTEKYFDSFQFLTAAEKRTEIVRITTLSSPVLTVNELEVMGEMLSLADRESLFESPFLARAWTRLFAWYEKLIDPNVDLSKGVFTNPGQEERWEWVWTEKRLGANDPKTIAAKAKYQIVREKGNLELAKVRQQHLVKGFAHRYSTDATTCYEKATKTDPSVLQQADETLKLKATKELLKIDKLLQESRRRSSNEK